MTAINASAQSMRGSAEARGAPAGITSTGGSSAAQGRPSTEKYKIQIQLSEKAKDRLFLLVEKTENETAAQVVRDALRIYDVLIEEMEKRGDGSELLIRSKETGETVTLRLF